MGVVYQAIDKLNGARCAVKVLEGTAHSRRFLREARILARLTHPAVVRYVGQGLTSSGELFLAMEWVEGTDLERRLLDGPLSLDEVEGNIRLQKRMSGGARSGAAATEMQHLVALGRWAP